MVALEGPTKTKPGEPVRLTVTMTIPCSGNQKDTAAADIDEGRKLVTVRAFREYAVNSPCLPAITRVSAIASFTPQATGTYHVVAPRFTPEASGSASGSVAVDVGV